MGSVTTVRKNNGPCRFIVVDEIQQNTLSLAGFDQPEFLIHGVGGDALWLHHNMFWINGPGVRQSHDRVVERGRKEQGLSFALVGGLVNDSAHVWDEPHVEHAIGFVNHQAFHFAQVNISSL